MCSDPALHKSVKMCKGIRNHMFLKSASKCTHLLTGLEYTWTFWFHTFTVAYI